MIRSPCQFLCEFLLVGAFLLLGWTYVSDLYLESLLGGVNLGLCFTNTSIYLRSGESFTQGVACPDVVAAAALFAASSAATATCGCDASWGEERLRATRSASLCGSAAHA